MPNDRPNRSAALQLLCFAAVLLAASRVASADIRDYIYAGSRLLAIAGPLGITIDDIVVTEGNVGTTIAAFTVRLSAPTSQVVTVDFATAPNTATAGVDYVPISGTVTFPSGSTAQTINVEVIGDTEGEPDETFFVNLSGAVNAAVVDGQGVGTILANDDPDLIFKDGFESGTTAAWSHTVSDEGDLSVSAAAALKSTTFGLQGLVDDKTSIRVQDDSPVDENRYRARFYLDPNGFDPGEAQGNFRTRVFIVFADNPIRRLAAIVLKRQAGNYSVQARARRDDNSQADTGFFPISDGPHVIELDLKGSSGATANDGWIQLWIDGSSAAVLSNLDNDLVNVDLVRMGALSVKEGASGTIYWDEFESRRINYIGP